MKLSFQLNRALFSPLLMTLVTGAAAATASCGPAPVSGNPNPSPSVEPAPTSTVPVMAPTGDPTKPSTNPTLALGTFKGSGACKGCHEGIWNDWSVSMHSRALTGAVAVAQSNQIYGLELKDKGLPDPARFCVSCHSPIATAFAEKSEVKLPYKGDGKVDPEALKEGIGCVTCHAYIGTPSVAAGTFSDFLNDFDVSGITYYGPFSDPADSPAHNSVQSSTLGASAEQLCMNCHNVIFDANNDGLIKPGEDVILQTTTIEHDDLYLKKRSENCLDCHMKPKGSGKAADGPDAPPGVPTRQIRHHSFVGTDYPLDDAANDQQLGLRQELLADAATLELVNPLFVQGAAADTVTFNVKITNTKSGHNLPTGFAFCRQMFVEARVLASFSTSGNKEIELAQSGSLKNVTDDLCDAGTLGDALQNFVKGCEVGGKNQADPQLVNFQAKLVDDIDVGMLNGVQIAVQAAKGKETWVQFLEGGAVGRFRNNDAINGDNLAPLAPFESRSFAYTFNIAKQADAPRLEVKLRFRNLPPYFLNVLSAKEPSLAPRISGHIKDLKIITMQTVTKDF